MNKENILKVADAIALEPAAFDMQYPQLCVAGFAVQLFGRVGHSSGTYAGATHLGLRHVQAHELFYCRSMDTAHKSGIEHVTEAVSIVPDALRWMVKEEDINWRRAFTAVMMDNELRKDK